MTPWIEPGCALFGPSISSSFYVRCLLLHLNCLFKSYLRTKLKAKTRIYVSRQISSCKCILSTPSLYTYFHFRKNRCHRCAVIYQKHHNVIQYKESKSTGFLYAFVFYARKPKHNVNVSHGSKLQCCVVNSRMVTVTVIYQTPRLSFWS